MKMMWFRRVILCLRRLAQIYWLRIGILFATSAREVWISCLSETSKSSWSREFNGTTGCSKCVELRHLAQIFS